MMKHLLLHRKLYIRFLSLYTLGIGFILVMWILSYLLLPEGFLYRRTGAQLLAGHEAAESYLVEWLRISSINLSVGILFIVGPNFPRWHGYPMGYVTPLIWAILYAIYLGTNSFTFPLPEGKMLPSLSILGCSGPYEIGAYILAAVSTHSLPMYELKGPWLSERIQSISPSDRGALTREQVHGLGIAVIMLLRANAREEYRIMTRF